MIKKEASGLLFFDDIFKGILSCVLLNCKINSKVKQMNHSLFIKQQVLLLTISFLLLIIFFPIYGEVDLNLIQPWMSTHGEFFLKSNWYLDTLNHRYVKQLLSWLMRVFLGFGSLLSSSNSFNYVAQLIFIYFL